MKRDTRSRYFFDLIDRDLPVVDDDGAAFETQEQAAAHALRCARDIIANDVLVGRPIRLGSYLSVQDGDRRELQRLYLRDAFTIEDA